MLDGQRLDCVALDTEDIGTRRQVDARAYPVVCGDGTNSVTGMLSYAHARRPLLLEAVGICGQPPHERRWDKNPPLSVIRVPAQRAGLCWRL